MMMIDNKNKRCAVIFTFPIISHVNPILALVDELRKNDFGIKVFAIDKFKELIEFHGAEYVDYGKKAKQTIENFERGCGDLKDIYEFAIECDNKVETYINDITRINPDVIIHDTMCLIGKQVSEITGIPSVSVCTSFAVKNTTLGIPYVRKRKAIYANLTRFTYWLKFRRADRVLTRKYGIQKAKVQNLYFNYEKKNIVCALKWMQPHNELYGDEFVFVGEMVCDQQEESSEIALLKSEKKLLYISFGSLLAADRDFYLKCVEMFGNSEINVVMNIGKYADVKSFGEMPDNVYISNYLPQIEVLKKADAFVSHGGMNSVTEAIRYGVPMVVIPFSGDEPSVARALREKQIGVVIEKENIDYDLLKQSVEELIYDEKYKRNCELFKAEYSKAGGSKTAVAEISRYLDGN